MLTPFAPNEDSAVMITRRYRSFDRPSGVDTSKGVSRTTERICRHCIERERSIF